MIEKAVTTNAGARHAPIFRSFRWTLVGAVVITLGFAWLVFVGLARIGGSQMAWIWPDIGAIDPDKQNTRDLVIGAVTATGLLGAAYAAVYSYRKQRVDEAAGSRADEESFSKRYQEAATLLGGATAALRLAGVYAMARLADDWPQQRQVCIDVLTAYLRMPLALGVDGAKPVGEPEVRQAIVHLIELHLRPGADIPWSQRSFDFSNTEFVDLKLSDVSFDGPVTFDRAIFTGKTRLTNITAREGMSFRQSQFHDRFDIDDLKLVSGTLDFEDFNIIEGADISIVISAMTPEAVLRVYKVGVLGRFSCYIDPSATPQGLVFVMLVLVYVEGRFFISRNEVIGKQPDSTKIHIPRLKVEGNVVVRGAGAGVYDDADQGFRCVEDGDIIPPPNSLTAPFQYMEGLRDKPEPQAGRPTGRFRRMAARTQHLLTGLD